MDGLPCPHTPLFSHRVVRGARGTWASACVAAGFRDKQCTHCPICGCRARRRRPASTGTSPARRRRRSQRAALGGTRSRAAATRQGRSVYFSPNRCLANTFQSNEARSARRLSAALTRPRFPPQRPARGRLRRPGRSHAHAVCLEGEVRYPGTGRSGGVAARRPGDRRSLEIREPSICVVALTRAGRGPAPGPLLSNRQRQCLSATNSGTYFKLDSRQNFGKGDTWDTGFPTGPFTVRRGC
jgi:hypothetical protein